MIGLLLIEIIIVKEIINNKEMYSLKLKACLISAVLFLISYLLFVINYVIILITLVLFLV